MAKFALQRKVEDFRTRGYWFDADLFDDKEKALQTLRWARSDAQARIDADGGSGYTGRRVQKMRVIEIIS